MGESFGIYGIKGYSLDIAMPRREHSSGRGHKDFDVFVDPFLGTYKAAMRRDFTVNAIMENVLTGEIKDYFHGVDDIKNGIIRHVNEQTFKEDPLRVLRAAQFAARLGYSIDQKTKELCSLMDITALTKERVLGEVKKALLKSQRPSIFFQSLKEMNQLQWWFCEMSLLIGLEQNKTHHAEGDVWVHTMMTLDAAASLKDRASDPFGFMLAAALHDLGKSVCTKNIGGVIHSYGHEEAGLPLAQEFLKRITNEKKLISYVLSLVKDHMKPNIMANQHSSIKATNKMFDGSVDPQALIALACADSLGKLPAVKESNEEFLNNRLETYREYMSRPFVSGNDLINAGIQPTARFSEYMNYAHKLRLAGVGKESAMKQTLAYISNVERNI